MEMTGVFSVVTLFIMILSTSVFGLCLLKYDCAVRSFPSIKQYERKGEKNETDDNKTVSDFIG